MPDRSDPRKRTLSLGGYRLPKGVSTFYRNGWRLIFRDRSRRAYGLPGERWIDLGTHSDLIAARKAVELVQRFELGTYDPWKDDIEALSLAEAVERYLGHDPALRASTLRERRYTLGAFSRHFEGATLARIQSADVSSFLYSKELKASTRRGYHSKLRTFFRWCLREGHLEQDPVSRLKPPKAEASTPAFLSAADVERLVRTVEADYELRRGTIAAGPGGDGIIWLADVVRFAVGTGLRLSELCALRWMDVELSEEGRVRRGGPVGGRVYVRGYEAAGSKVGRPFKTKTGKERRVPLAAEAAAVLRRRRASRLTEDPRETVFVGPGGGPLAPGVVSRRFRHYRRLAKLPEEIHFHSLRHTCASWLATRGVSLRIIQEVLGHADVKSTQIYAHLASEVDGQITEALDATLDAARASEREVRGKAAQTVSRADLIAALQELIGAS